MTKVTVQNSISEPELISDYKICQDKKNIGKFYMDKSGNVWMATKHEYGASLIPVNKQAIAYEFADGRLYRELKKVTIIVEE